MSGKLFLREKLNKIIWFYSSQEHFNYFITKGTTQTLRLNKEEIMILQHLMIKMAEELGYDTDWIEDPKSFILSVQNSLDWANRHTGKLIFGYSPDDETQKLRNKFDNCMYDYRREPNDETYNNMLNSFSDFFEEL